MSKQIITDYMAGQIGDKYYELTDKEPECIGVVSVIDHVDDDFRYNLANDGKDIGWPNRGKFDYFEREAPDEASDSDDGMDRITDIKQVKPGDIEVWFIGHGRVYTIKWDRYLSSTLGSAFRQSFS